MHTHIKKIVFVLFLFLSLTGKDAYGEAAFYRAELDYARKAIIDGFYELAEVKLNTILYLDIPKTIEGEARLLLGKVYFSKAEPVRALTEFNYVLNKFKDPDFLANAHYWIAEVYFEQKQYVKALAGYQKVISGYFVSEYAPFALYSQAWCYEKMGEYQMAIEVHRDVINDFPDKELAVKSQYKICEIMYRNFNNIEAREELLLFIEKYPVNERIFDAYYMLGDVYYRSGQNTKAVINFKRSLKGGKNKQWKAPAEYKLAKLYFLDGNLTESDHWLEKAAADTYDDRLLCSAILFRARIRQEDIEQGTGLFQSGEDEMIRFYETVCSRPKINELTDDAFYLLGDHYYRTGQIHKSVQTYKKAVDQIHQSGISDKLHYGYAWSLLKNLSYEEALREFYFVVDNSDDENLKVSSLFSIAYILKEKREFTEAASVYDIILKEFPDTISADLAQYEIGVILKDLGRIDAAILAFRALEANFKESDILDKALFRLGDIYMSKGDYLLANIQFNRIIYELSGSDLTEEALLQKAIALYNSGSYEDAVDICNSIEGKDPEIKVRSEYYAAWSNYKLGNSQQALAIFSMLLKNDNAAALTSGILLWFGQYYYEKGEFDLSMYNFERVINNYPATIASNQAFYWLGWVLFDTGQEEKSIEQFRKLIHLYPDSQKTPQAILSLGDIYLKKGDTDKAIKELEFLIQEFPENKITNIAKEKIGTSFKLRKEYMRAIDYYKMALTDENSEINSQIQFDIAECYDKSGLVQEAIEEYLNVEYRYPKSEYWVTRAVYRCAELLEIEGEIDRAIKLYRKLSVKSGKEAEKSRNKVKTLQRYTR